MFKSLLPQYESTFSAGRYNSADHIEPHDDRAYKEIDSVTYSRHIALIYYAAKDWSEEDGGALVDLEGSIPTFVPEFNSLVAFAVPRWHAVEPVTTTTKPRLSIFGWFLKQGTHYPLDLGSDAEGADAGDFGESDDEDTEAPRRALTTRGRRGEEISVD